MREPKISLVNGLWAQIKIDLYRQYKYTASSYTISIPHLSQKVSFMVGPSKARHGSLERNLRVKIHLPLYPREMIEMLLECMRRGQERRPPV
jgi:hypothetical protein